jgi:PilZ domain
MSALLLGLVRCPGYGGRRSVNFHGLPLRSAQSSAEIECSGRLPGKANPTKGQITGKLQRQPKSCDTLGEVARVADRTERQSDRIHIHLGIEVWGRDVLGQEFREHTQTGQVSRNGASIFSRQELEPGQEVNVIHSSSGKKASARVVGQLGISGDRYVYGVALNTLADFWPIRFPPMEEANQALVRVLLECRTCMKREVVCLNEVELEVFEVNCSLPRRCERCNSKTIWAQAPEDPSTPLRDRPLVNEARPSSTNKFGAERRRHRRITTTLPACIRQPGAEEDLVRTVDVSRGGLRFVSSRTYHPDSWVEVAVPYTRGAANIFIGGRIVRGSDLPGGQGLRQYGVEYKKATAREQEQKGPEAPYY